MKRPGVLVSLLLAAAPACDSSPTEPDAIYRSVAAGSFSDIDRRSVRVIRDQTSWTALLRQLQPNESPLPVNFSTEMLIGVFAGDRPTAGHRVLVERVIHRSSRFEIMAVDETPHPTCTVAQVITRPFNVIAVVRTDRAAEGEWIERVGPPCT